MDLLALQQLSPGWQAFFFGASFVFLVVQAILSRSIGWAGVALYVLVFFINELAAA